MGHSKTVNYSLQNITIRRNFNSTKIDIKKVTVCLKKNVLIFKNIFESFRSIGLKFGIEGFFGPGNNNQNFNFFPVGLGLIRILTQ